jgi:hypothetical protein
VTSTLRLLLVAAIVSTAVHYTDNFVNVDDFPQPGWVDKPVVAVSWLLLTAIGLLGYRLYANGRFFAAHALLAVYSYTGLSSLGHYLYGTPDPLLRNLSILADGLTGGAILAFVVWSASGRPAGGTVARA